jgi:hypothetical protein
MGEGENVPICKLTPLNLISIIGKIPALTVAKSLP